SVQQTEPQQRSHRARVTRAAEEDHLVIDLLMPRHPHASPAVPKRIHGDLSASPQRWLARAATRRQIDGVECVETQSTPQVARTHEVRLMHVSRSLRHQARVPLALHLVRTCSTSRQALPSQNATDCPHRRQRLNLELFQFPAYGLRAGELAGPLQPSSNKLDSLFDLGRSLLGPASRPSRLLLVPIRITGGVPVQPLVQPRARVTQGTTHRGDRLSLVDSLNRTSALRLRPIRHFVLAEKSRENGSQRASGRRAVSTMSWHPAM